MIGNDSRTGPTDKQVPNVSARFINNWLNTFYSCTYKKIDLNKINYVVIIHCIC